MAKINFSIDSTLSAGAVLATATDFTEKRLSYWPNIQRLPTGQRMQLRATPRADGGCHIEVINHRVARGLKGRLLGIMLTLVGAKVVPAQLQQTLDIIAKERPGVRCPALGD